MLASREVCSCMSWCLVGDLSYWACVDHLSTIATSVWTDVDDVVGRTHHLLIVLDDDDGIA